jgi:lysozyme family protein
VVVISVLHNLEASGDFSRHLHNGDPLTARTVHVPAGRPRSGQPPFSWQESAVDALEYDGLTSVTDWSIEHLAYLFEGFNGWGYRLYHPHVKSPYLWSFSNHYTRGKYVGDGKWSETAVSQQCGAMVLLKRIEQGGHIRFTVSPSEATDDRSAASSGLSVADRDADERRHEDTFPRDKAVTVLRSWPVETQLTDGPGIFGYYPAYKRYGTVSTIAALYEVGRIWKLRRSAPRVGVGDISLKGGGDIDGHDSHETGRDVDMRPMKNDGTEGPIIWWQTKYSHALTQELIDIIYANGIVKVKVIGFNDPNIQGCVQWENHDNHLHVRFYFQDEAPGYPTLQLGENNSPPVREFQRRLNNWKRQSGGILSLPLDGDFGQGTLQAVKDFQSAMGVEPDGVIGHDTWKQSLDYIV